VPEIAPGWDKYHLAEIYVGYVRQGEDKEICRTYTSEAWE
jgi:hypothetical protein